MLKNWNFLTEAELNTQINGRSVTKEWKFAHQHFRGPLLVLNELVPAF